MKKEMKKMNKTVFYKFDDFIDKFDIDKTKFGEWFDNNTNSVIRNDQDVGYDYINEIFSNVYQTFFEYYVYKKDYDWFDEDVELTQSDLEIFARRLINIYNNTYDRYIPLLKVYDQYIDNPSAPLHSETLGKSKFNDTPQDETIEGGFADDKHSTTFTTTKASSDADTKYVSEKVDELYRKWRDIYRDWTNEFKGLFMEVFD